MIVNYHLYNLSKHYDLRWLTQCHDFAPNLQDHPSTGTPQSISRVWYMLFQVGVRTIMNKCYLGVLDGKIPLLVGLYIVYLYHGIPVMSSWWLMMSLKLSSFYHLWIHDKAHFMYRAFKSTNGVIHRLRPLKTLQASDDFCAANLRFASYKAGFSPAGNQKKP